MKNYKKGLLALMVIAAMPLMASQSDIIYVNTFDDENGENPSKCSLREAIETAAKNKGIGGCTAGNTLVGQKDYIQLEAGTYKLNQELKPASQVFILGKTAADWEKKSPLTNDYPLIGALKTKIDGQNKTRLFNTVESEATLFLSNVELTNGYSANDGGALFIGGALTLDASAITSSVSDKSGGAIYLVPDKGEKTVTVNQALLQGNDAKQGSVFAMDCEANLLNTKAAITVSGSSIVKNGLVKDSSSTVDVCGNSSVTLSTNTIAKNRANTAIIHTASFANHPLSDSSILSFVSNTIVENQAPTAWLYDENGSKSLNYNVLAFNSGNACNYRSSNNVLIEKASVWAQNNALALTGANACILPPESATTDLKVENNIDVASMSLSSVLSSYQEASQYNLFLPLYYPKQNNSANDLIDLERTGCSSTDQRGLARVEDGTLTLDPAKRNSCDIGSVERIRLTAADIVNLSNISAVTLVDGLKTEKDRLKALLDNSSTNKDYLVMYQDDYNTASDLLKYTQQYLGYRTVFVDPLSMTLREEEAVPNSSAQLIKPLNEENYEITVESLGVGVQTGENATIDLTKIVKDSNLICEWKSDLKRAIMYRTDGKITNSSEAEYCSYAIKDRNSGVVTKGIMQARFVNIAPIAKDDTYAISSDTNLEVTVNPLENDSDDGDGPNSVLPAGKSIWHQNAGGKNTPIYFKSIPAGLNFTAEYSGPCPGGDVRNVCYGGKIKFSVKNAFSQFSYPITYKVYDAEGAESNEAIIYLQNQAKNTNESSSGGGSSNVFGLIVLAGLAVFRMRKFTRR